MLTRSRLAVAGAAAVLGMAAVLAAAPAASGSALAKTAPFPSAARTKLATEMAQAWQISRGQGVTIAVLSSVVDPVAGLAGKLTQGPDYAPLHGASAVNGTLLASMIAGSGPTATQVFGTIGRAPNAKVLAERVADYNSGHRGSSYQNNGTWQGIVAKAIRYAVNHGASVIVIDEGGGDDSPALDSAVAYAVSRNVALVGSMQVLKGKPTPLAYPDSLPGVINFTGALLTGLPKPAKTPVVPVNNSVLVTAPDNVLFATGPGNVPYTAWGSYSATAWVAGTVAMIKSVYPHITDAEVARALAESASYHPAGGYNTRIGFGLINPVGALHAAAALVKLQAAASPGSAVVDANARFGTRPVAVIEAVHHAPGKLAGYGAAIVVGLALLIIALVAGRRRRRVPALGGPPGYVQVPQQAPPAEPPVTEPPTAQPPTAQPLASEPGATEPLATEPPTDVPWS
ncbi:MAG TPA: hypothetical protein VGI58_03365 [Streptosporangiaceae bacterium]